VLFEASFNKLTEDQFLTSLAWDIASLQDVDDPRERAKEKGSSPRPTGLCLALVGALELLSAADWSILIFRPKFRIKISESRHRPSKFSL
jgi:hypothetical protein